MTANAIQSKTKETRIEYNGRNYLIVLNLNVMREIQAEYGTVNKWVSLIEEGDEPNLDALIFGYKEMINEGIEIDNDANGTHIEPVTIKQAGRIITAMGVADATKKLGDKILESAGEGSSKNA